MIQTQPINDQKLIDIFKKVLSSLGEKEQNVISRRIGLTGERETLQSIGNSFSPNITRERVRQIEDSGIKKMGRIIKATDLTVIQDKSKEIIDLHSGLITKDKLINTLIKELNLKSDINSSVLEIVIQADYNIIKSKPKLGVRTYFSIPNIGKKEVDSIHSESLKILKRKSDVMNKETLYGMIKDTLSSSIKGLNIVLIDNVVDIFEDIVKGEDSLIGLASWKILNPKTLKDKAFYVLKKDKVPMHFVDISNKITVYLGDKVKINTIHNELIRNNEFILIGRGIYALKEWGFTPGTIINVITDILTKNKDPMTTEDIIKEVLKVRNVKRTTIYMNLQNKKVIERVGRNYYQLKSNKK
ncbi:MAG: sigma factor-like helix-turn-helix DNA-binding protein [Candidatus Gracilibacteria bacterium]